MKKVTEKTFNEIENKLKAKRHAYNKCRNFAKRVQLNYEIEILYEEYAEAYQNFVEKD